MHRRAFIAALALLPFASWAPPAAGDALAGFYRQGSGEYRKFGFLIYEATLWTSGLELLEPPYALGLTYRRAISSQQLVDASVSEMRKLRVADETRLMTWAAELSRIFPDVKPGDRIIGIHEPAGARFMHNTRWIGEVRDPAFAEAFFGIWLHPNTSAPALRAALLATAAS